jgi:CarboxypepD_reg-like domain/Secretion system C-terminal sorting domain
MKHVILLIGALLCATLQTMHAQESSLSGNVLDEETNEPITGATVYLETHKQKAITDVTGHFQFKGVEGAYTLKVFYTGYPNTTVTGVASKSTQNEAWVFMEPGFMLQEVVIVADRVGQQDSRCCMCVAIKDTTQQERNQPVTLFSVATSIFPNPASDQTSIDISSDTDVFLFDAAGRMVHSLPDLNAGRHQLIVSHLPAGVYSVAFSNTMLKPKQLVVVRE